MNVIRLTVVALLFLSSPTLLAECLARAAFLEVFGMTRPRIELCLPAYKSYSTTFGFARVPVNETAKMNHNAGKYRMQANGVTESEIKRVLVQQLKKQLKRSIRMKEKCATYMYMNRL